MLKIAMITPGLLPVPAVKGGAVEVLIENLIKGNEISGKCIIDCYTIRDDKIADKQYRYTSIKIVDIKKITKIKNRIVNYLYTFLGIKKWRTSFSRETIKLLKNEKYDYVVVHNNLMAYRDIYEKTENKDNLIYVLHNNINDDINHVIIAKLIAKTANRILAVSEYTKKQFKNITDAKRIDVLYNCIDLNQYFVDISNRERIAVRKKYNIMEDEFVFIYSGRIDVFKGVLELVKAFKLMCNERTKLLIVGKSWFSDDKKEDGYTEILTKEINDIRQKVVFSGFVNPKDMPLMYKISDCLVIPSIWEEPFGVVALEGMASGLPLIVTNSGGLTEIVDEDSAIIVNKENNLVENLSKSMLDVMENDELRMRIKNNAINVIKNTKDFDSKNYFSIFCNKIGI